MAKPNKADKADRRAVVEQMRREQKRKERRQSLLVLAAALTVGGVIIGVAIWQIATADNKEVIAGLGVAASEAGCQEVATKDAEGSNDHRPDGSEISYDNAPPAFGPHWGSFLLPTEIRKLYTADDRPPVEKLVHSLEHGHTILWYDETIAEDEQSMDELEEIAEQFPSNSDPNDKFIAAPWTSEDGEAFPDDTHVALTHWSIGGDGNLDGQQGVWQYCSEVSGEVVDDFMEQYPYTDSPEPDAA